MSGPIKFDQDLEGLVYNGQALEPSKRRRFGIYVHDILTQPDWAEYFKNNHMGAYKLASAPECYDEFKFLAGQGYPADCSQYNIIREQMDKYLITGTTINAGRGLLYIEPDYLYDADDHTGPDDRYYFNLQHPRGSRGVAAREALKTLESRKFMQKLFGTQDSAADILNVLSTVSGVALENIQLRYHNALDNYPAPVALVLTTWLHSNDPVLVVGAGDSDEIKGRAMGVEI